MRNHLNPEQRVDRNGRVVTRHVKQDTQPTGQGKNMPAPSLSPKPKKARKKPLAKQLISESSTPGYLKDIAYSPSLLEAMKDDESKDMGKMNPDTLIFIKGTDVEKFKVLSVVAPGDAVLFLHVYFMNTVGRGAVTPEEVTDYLHENHLDNLIVDREEMMQQAMERRIKPSTIIELDRKYNINNYDPTVFLDAARVQDSVLGGKASDAPFVKDVLDGKIDLKDIEALGFTLIDNSPMRMVHEKLKKLKSGELSYGTSTMRWFLSKAMFSRHHYEVMEKISDEMGEDFARTLDHIEHAVQVEHRFSSFSTERKRELMEYSNHDWGRTDVGEIVKLHDAGVDPVEAISLLKTIRVDQIIELKKNGISSSVSTGWL